MNKQELIKSISEMSVTPVQENRNSILRLPYVSQTAVLGMVRELEEPQKVVIPRFVAEWIEKCKKHLNIYGVFAKLDKKDCQVEVLLWFFEKSGTRSNIIARAWLDGYEVEQEKLYTVEIPNPNSKGDNKIYLCKDSQTGKLLLCKGKFNPCKNKNLWLTETEVKQDFEWAWKFAKEVE